MSTGRMSERAQAIYDDHSKRKEILDLLNELSGDELDIARTSVKRLVSGRKAYSQWNVDDSRDYMQEVLEETVDAAHYISALMLKLKRKGVCK